MQKKMQPAIKKASQPARFFITKLQTKLLLNEFSQIRRFCREEVTGVDCFVV